MKPFIFLICLFSSTALFVRAAAEALLVPPTEEARAGRVLKLNVYLNNPSADRFDFVMPDDMQAALASPSEQRRLMVVPVGVAAGTKISIAPMSFAVVTVAVVLPDTLEGTVALRMIDLRTNPVMFKVSPATVVRATPKAVNAAEVAIGNHTDDVDLTSDREAISRHISVYDPIYFAVGFHGGANARFQFSFKYLLVAPNSNDPGWWRSLYFGYTQTSLWDLSAPSKPFYDTSYKPTLFYYHEAFKMKPSWLSRLGLQAGIQHESNGKGATDSRSLNTLYVTPTAVWSTGGQWRLLVAPRFIAYMDKAENSDLARYRGNVDLLIRFGQDKGLQFAAMLRKGNVSSYGSGQLDVTWPLRYLPGLSANAGGYLQLQYFNGWGESLLDYNKRQPDQLRFGYTLAR